MSVTHHVRVSADVTFGNDLPFVFIGGPCVLESKQHAFDMCGALVEITKALDIPFVYKSSFDKANRNSINSSRGLGIEKSLEVFQDIKKSFNNVPIVTDVHEKEQCAIVASVVDILQIPAFLCRQTDLLRAAAITGKALNIKKGQFLAPWEMKNIVDKVESFGNKNILLCDRGTSFGYNTLISDFRGLPIMAQTGYPVVFDATHSVQQPGGNGTTSGGQREFAPVLARAALAVGTASIFAEVHQDPPNAPSDGPNMLYLNQIKEYLEVFKEIDQISKANPVKI